jgi:hypothetical protein
LTIEQCGGVFPGAGCNYCNSMSTMEQLPNMWSCSEGCQVDVCVACSMKFGWGEEQKTAAPTAKPANSVRVPEECNTLKKVVDSDSSKVVPTVETGKVCATSRQELAASSSSSAVGGTKAPSPVSSTAAPTAEPANSIRVPEDCNTLMEAVDRVHGDDLLTTIVVGKGEHQIDGPYLEIASAMNIVGDPGVAKEEIVVVGGFKFEKEIQGNCHLQHLTLRQASCGVMGESSFTMEDVLVEQCESGVGASGTGVVVRCTNVEIRQCGGAGLVAHCGASITLIGAKTMVHHNATRGQCDAYGLMLLGASSTIQLISPLTKEQVFIDNGGGGNWGVDSGSTTGDRGDINQIKTISQ